MFLTERYAYKLKKPAQFEFLDFSTPELRHRACLDEAWLNRCLAPDVYVAVLAITQDAHGSLAFNGRGPVVDWVVKMRWLPADAALHVVLREKRLAPQDAESIVTLLTDFDAHALPKSLRACLQIVFCGRAVVT